ncbi:MAG: SH3 domain-containing protein [Burkholderiales bacterium]|nr:SH3 domain-containing protein [Burkholderiales bacterium]
MIRARVLKVGKAGYCLLLALLLAAGAAQAQQGEAALMKRTAELREAPGEAARSLAPLAAQSPVTRTGERQGAWIQVRSAAGATGWVHMFDVGPAGTSASTSAPTGNSAAGALRGITGLFNKGGAQQQTSSPTSTIGIRGLGAEDLANAQPNMNGVLQMEALRQGESQARDFAAEASLASATVPALPLPARPRAPQAGPNTGQMP